jgi:lysozyme
MRVSPEGLALVQRHEGCILQAYDDFSGKVIAPGQPVMGVLTIGWGHTGADVTAGKTITQVQAGELLARDLERAEREIARLVNGVVLKQSQFDALASFEFNTGGLEFTSGKGTKQLSGLMQAVISRRWADAAHEFTRWYKDNGRALNGLMRRRLDEAQLFMRDV